jgi:tetratricopeptide (TPR) repeat protein
MKRGCLSLLFACVALAQVRPQEDPIQAVVRAYQTARDHGQSNEAAAKREVARSLLDQIAPDSQFGNSVWTVAQLYQGSGLSAQAMAIAQQALARATTLDTRIQLLQMVSDFYQQDRNLLQAVMYRERLVTALDEAATKPPAEPNSGPGMVRMGSFGANRGFQYIGGDRRMAAYQQLADLYKELGRPDAVAATTKRLIAITKDPGSLAQFYQQQGQLDEAAAIYKKQADQADPSARVGALQSLANVYQQEQRYAEAADAFQQATAAINASGKPEMQSQTVWTRISMARALNLAGKTPAGDDVFEQLLAESASAPEGTYLQVLTNYANYLAETKREDQGQGLLKDYLASHPNLQPQEEANLLYQLANSARRLGDAKLAERYQQEAQEKQRGSQPAPVPRIMIGPDLQKAQTAANAGKLDEAFEIALQALGTAARAVDRDQVTWQVPNLATQFANRKQPAKAEQLYQGLFGVVESWSADNPQALIGTAQNYARFLTTSDRWNEAPAAIKRYRDLIVGAHGVASFSLGDVLRLSIQFEGMHGTPQHAIKVAEDLVALHESLGGNTSDLYLGAAEELARQYQASGDPGSAIPIFRRNAEIADLAFRPGDVRRAQFRITAAWALAQQRQFDEAEKLATEAVAISTAMRPPQGTMFTNQLEQIRKMRTASQTSPATENNPWFRRSKSQN